MERYRKGKWFFTDEEEEAIGDDPLRRISLHLFKCGTEPRSLRLALDKNGFSPGDGMDADEVSVFLGKVRENAETLERFMFVNALRKLLKKNEELVM